MIHSNNTRDHASIATGLGSIFIQIIMEDKINLFAEKAIGLSVIMTKLDRCHKTSK